MKKIPSVYIVKLTVGASNDHVSFTACPPPSSWDSSIRAATETIRLPKCFLTFHALSNDLRFTHSICQEVTKDMRNNSNVD